MLAVVTTLILLTPPQVELPKNYVHQSAALENEQPWWQSLEILGLPQVATLAKRNNGNAQSSKARLRQAQQLAHQMRAQMFPSLSADASFGIQPLNNQSAAQAGLGTNAPPGVNLPDFFYNGRAALSARYVADISGRNFLNYRAQKRSAQSQKAEHATLMHGVIQQGAAALLDLASANEQLALLHAQLKSSEALLEVTELRYQNGESQSAEVLQQRQQVQQQQLQIPNAAAQVDIAKRRLAVVLGDYRLPEGLELASTLSQPSFEVASGRPADLLEYRADVWSAASLLESASDSYGVAWRAHLPTLTISGNYGINYNYITDWNTFESWGASASLSVPLFTGLGNFAAQKAAKANKTSTERAYEQSVREAIIDIENSLQQLKAQEQSYLGTLALLNIAQDTYDRAKDSYLSGVGSYLSTLTALRSLQSTEFSVVQQKRSSWAAIINAHAAVGGPWMRSLAADEN